MTAGTPTTAGSRPRLRLDATAAGALAAYGIVGVLHLASQLTGNTSLADATQSLAAPCLLVALVAQTRLRSRLTRFTAGGLLWSWAGDTVPDVVPDSGAFVVLMLCFLVAHVLLVIAFWPWREESLLHTRVAWLYAAVAVVLVVACAPRAGALTVAIAVYAVALAVMALLAAGVNRLALVGGVLFLVSDGLLAVGEFVPAIAVPDSGFWVMATYLSALLGLTLGVLRREASRVRRGPHAAQ